MTWVWSLEPVYRWRKKSNAVKLSSDLHSAPWQADRYMQIIRKKDTLSVWSSSVVYPVELNSAHQKPVLAHTAALFTAANQGFPWKMGGYTEKVGTQRIVTKNEWKSLIWSNSHGTSNHVKWNKPDTDKPYCSHLHVKTWSWSREESGSYQNLGSRGCLESVPVRRNSALESTG